jgi:hypothetical protein
MVMFSANSANSANSAVSATLAAALMSAAATTGAFGNDLFSPKPTFPASPTLEKLTSQPSSSVVPLDRPDATKLALPYMPPPPFKRVIWNGPGGRIDDHTDRFADWARHNAEVEIRGRCHSACTLVMSSISREHICFSPSGYLSFHQASYGNGSPSLEHTHWMINSYPADIQDWIKVRGGAETMPFQGQWILNAEALWKMGYRKCPDKAFDLGAR